MGSKQPRSPQPVLWKSIDTALGAFSTDSLLAVLTAAVDAPACAAWYRHLLLLWTRIVKCPARAGVQARAADVPALLQAAVRAAPELPVLGHRPPCDPRQEVRFPIAGSRLRVHPGDLEHPPLFLRCLVSAADVLDPLVHQRYGFNFSDVMELALRHSDATVRLLAPAWPPPAATGQDPDPGCEALTDAEVDAARAVLASDLTTTAAGCRAPDRAAAALQWLTADASDLLAHGGPDECLPGRVLQVTAHGRRIPVPAAVVLSALGAAVGEVIGQMAPDGRTLQELQRRTVERLGDLLNLPAWPDQPPSPWLVDGPRMSIAVVSSLGPGLSTAVEQARETLGSAEPDRARVVVYGGPGILGREVITDTAYVHVEELAEILTGLEGDHTALACFLLELTEHPSVTGIAYLDLLDAWQMWRDRHGSLLPPGPDRDDIAFIPTYPAEPTWDRAAAWEAIDTVLSAAGMPPALGWRAARLLEAGQADLFDSGIAVMASADPPLVILARDPGPGAQGPDIDTLVGIADGLRITLTSHPNLAEHFRLPGDVPLTLLLTPGTAQIPPRDPQTSPDPDVTGIAFAVDAEHAAIALDLGPGLLECFAGDGHDGHPFLGRVLHHLVARLRTERGGRPGVDLGGFMAAWETADPVGTLNAVETWDPALAVRDTLPRGPYLRTRVLRTVAAEVRARGIPTGSYHNRAALPVCAQLLDVLESVLANHVRSYPPELAIEVARRLNAAQAARILHDRRVGASLAGPWAGNWQQEAMDPDRIAVTYALQILLETALAGPPAGDRPLDVLAVAELVDLTELMAITGITSVAAGRTLHGLTVDIDASGLFSVEDRVRQDETRQLGHLGLNIGAYQHALRALHVARQERSTPNLVDPAALFESDARTPHRFTGLQAPRGSGLTKADRLLKDQWGCGFDAIAAVLGTAVDWPADPDGLARVTADDLVAAAEQWSGLPATEIHAALRTLILTPGQLTDAREHFYTEVERRHRLVLRPLIDLGGQLIVMPWLVAAAQRVHGAYAADARLPHPEVPDNVRQAMSVYRQQLEKQLERDLHDVAHALGLPHCFQFLKEAATAAGIPELEGEVDLLVADPATSRLWVCEAKMPHRAFSPHTLLQHLQRFTDRGKGYTDKLLAKTRTIQQHADAAARACGVTEPRRWKAIPLFVTRAVEPAAFTTAPPVAFTVSEHLAAVFIHPSDPLPGYTVGAGRGIVEGSE